MQYRFLKNIVISVPLVFLLGAGGLNYSGFCMPELRYKSDQERVQTALLAVLEKYPPAVVLVNTEVLPEGGVLRSYAPPADPVFYKNVTEFLQENPDCCRLVTKPQLEARPRTFGEAVTGSYYAYLDVRYAVKYRDSELGLMKVEARTLPTISNCGAPDWHERY